MGNDNKKVKIFVMLKYAFVFGVIVVFVAVFGTILPFLPILFPPSTNQIFNVVWVIVGSIIIAMGIVTSVVAYQTATLDENGIILKIAVWKVAEIKWTDIVKAEVKSLVTLQSTLRSFNKQWIILYTNFNQEAKAGSGNRKNHPPWQIIYNKKNAETIKYYLKGYSNIKLNIK